mgnify:CR=1 FL=1|tara:strand:- start:151 stop:336 length:186 start_codon:yes stop_codon:yes gene_type:complete
MYSGEIWSCYHKDYRYGEKFKPIIVVKIIDNVKADVVVNTYDNFFKDKIEIKNLVFDYRLK